MKRILVFFVLLVFVSVLLAEQPEQFELEFRSFYVPPTSVTDFTLFDYMHGGYTGYPIRIQEDNIDGQGVYFTYMREEAGRPRFQNWAFFAMDGELKERDKEVNPNSSTHREGYGSLAIDPVTGNPIFAWHAAPYDISPPSEAVLNTYFAWDSFDWFNEPGLAWADYSILSNNVERPPAQRWEFIWPIVYVGPSPMPDRRRVYIFHSNGGDSMTGGQSSNIMLIYADFRTEDFAGQTDLIVWTEKTVEYLEKLHNWRASDDGFVQVFRSYAVGQSGNAIGKVAIAGQLYGTGTEEWGDFIGHPDHDYIVLYNNNYGEGDFAEFPFFMEHRVDNPAPLKFNPTEVAGLPANTQADIASWETFRLFTGGTGGDLVTSHFMGTERVNNKTLAFDESGNLLIPSFYFFGHNTISQEPGSWYPFDIGQSIHVFKFNPDTAKMTIAHVAPYYKFEAKDYVPFFFDTTGDGFVDINPAPDGSLAHIAPNNYPIPHHAKRDIDFHYNGMRLTQVNNGVVAMMWMDSFKATENYEDPTQYTEWNAVTEIMVSISVDSGETWSKPFSLNYNDFPEMSSRENSVSAFVWPADKIILLGDGYVRLYFMYTDDFSWGSGSISPPFGTNNGAAVRFAAADFKVPVLSTEKTPSVKPLSMLSQNYPNPFNPSTTIKFNIPKSGNVKLSVYNVRGQLVNNLIDSNMIAGDHAVVWNGMDSQNRSVASGVYFYRIETDGKIESKRMVLMK